MDKRVRSRAVDVAERGEGMPTPLLPLDAGDQPRDAGGVESTVRFLRRLLLSDYFILYLTVAYFAAMAVLFPDLATARNISNQLSNIWPLLAVAIGQTLVIIIMGIDLSQGAIMG